MEHSRNKNYKRERSVQTRFNNLNKLSLAIGYQVMFLTLGTTGRVGDNSSIVKFTGLYVVMKFRNGGTTKRAGKNLVYKS